MILISFLLTGILGFCCYSVIKSQNDLIKDITEAMIEMEENVYYLKKDLEKMKKNE